MAASEIRARSVSAAVLCTLVFGALLSGWDIAYATLIPVIGGLALWEFYAALENRGIRTFRRLGTACGVFFLLASWAILSGTIAGVGQPLFEWISMLVLLLGLLTTAKSSTGLRRPPSSRSPSPSLACSMSHGSSIS